VKGVEEKNEDIPNSEATISHITRSVSYNTMAIKQKPTGIPLQGAQYQPCRPCRRSNGKHGED
jgi:hypothetical protein